MVQPRGRAPLALGALRRAAFPLDRNPLHGHVALEPLVPRLPHHAVAAGSDPALELVAAEHPVILRGLGLAPETARTGALEYLRSQLFGGGRAFHLGFVFGSGGPLPPQVSPFCQPGCRSYSPAHGCNSLAGAAAGRGAWRVIP